MRTDSGVKDIIDLFMSDVVLLLHYDYDTQNTIRNLVLYILVRPFDPKEN